MCFKTTTPSYCRSALFFRKQYVASNDKNMFERKRNWGYKNELIFIECGNINENF